MSDQKNDKILEVKNLKVSYHTYAGEVKSVRGVSFDLKEGEAIAIVGESGSGKSVTTKAIMGILAKLPNPIPVKSSAIAGTLVKSSSTSSSSEPKRKVKQVTTIPPNF